LIGDGSTGRIPKIERRLARVERIGQWAAGAVAAIGFYLKATWK
jgi:hypothetical protein